MIEKIERVYPVRITLICSNCGCTLYYDKKGSKPSEKIHSCKECMYGIVMDKEYPCIEYVTEEKFYSLEK